MYFSREPHAASEQSQGSGQAQRTRRSVAHDSSIPPAQGISSEQYGTGLGHQPDHDIAPRSRLDSLAMISAQRADDSLHNPPPQLNSNGRGIEQSASADNAMRNLLSQGSLAHHSPASAPSRNITTPQASIPNGVAGSIYSAVQHADDGEQSGSYGTLMLSKEGRSKYLGPTAGSEWLKDVSLPDFLALHKLM